MFHKTQCFLGVFFRLFTVLAITPEGNYKKTCCRKRPKMASFYYIMHSPFIRTHKDIKLSLELSSNESVDQQRWILNFSSHKLTKHIIHQIWGVLKKKKLCLLKISLPPLCRLGCGRKNRWLCHVFRTFLKVWFVAHQTSLTLNGVMKHSRYGFIRGVVHVFHVSKHIFK